MTVLAQSIHDEIQEHGSISFARFMELALYSPLVGYYERSEDRIGRKGDYYTSVSVGPLFGEMLCWQFVQWLRNVDSHDCKIVECGAHSGRLAMDILACLRDRHPGAYERVTYFIVEPSAGRRKRQGAMLDRFGNKVKWFESMRPLVETGVDGIIFSNELLDAMPVHRFGWDAGRHEWFEWTVAVSGNHFVWDRRELANNGEAVIPRLPDALLEVLPDEYTVEISPAATDWWMQAARALRRGKLMAIDYGLSGEELFRPERAQGTLRAYREHRVSDDVLACPGEQDITGHVNFSELAAAGEREGLETEELTDQSRFLTRILQGAIKEPGSGIVLDPDGVRQFQTLTHPDHLGRAFKVFVQSRP